MSQFKAPGLTWHNFGAEVPQVLGAISQNVVSSPTWSQDLCNPAGVAYPTPHAHRVHVSVQSYKERKFGYIYAVEGVTGLWIFLLGGGGVWEGNTSYCSCIWHTLCRFCDECETFLEASVMSPVSRSSIFSMDTLDPPIGSPHPIALSWRITVLRIVAF
jgi:hypothetical protein